MRSRSARGVGYSVTGGFYGGYAGEELQLSWGPLAFEVGTWGIETSAAYQVLGQRLYLGSLRVLL